MSGVWAKGSNKAVSQPPPDGGFQTVGPGGRPSSLKAAVTTAGGGKNRSSGNNWTRPNGSGGGGSNNNNSNRRTAGRSNGQHQGGTDDVERSGSGNRGGRGGGRGRGGTVNVGVVGRQNNTSNSGNHTRRGGQASTGSTNNHYNQQEGRTERIVIKDAQLLTPGMGTTLDQEAIKRISAKDFILLRTRYMDADPERFNSHPECHWTADDREEIITALCSKVMELGDVSKVNKKAPNDTAPPLEDCKPLEVNEETRWKSKAMLHQMPVVNEEPREDSQPESEEEVIGKALLILNKISWTTLEKLTLKFIEETKLTENDSIRNRCIDLLIKKAQTEQHFGPMYAQLCAIISKRFKQFKKDLLVQCQAEFELDTAHKIAKATKGMTDPQEIEYHATLIRKAYVGHIKFLGELYLRDIVKLTVMMYCLEELLKDETDEENLECFVHLLTTMGEKLDGHAKQNNKPFQWEKVDKIRNSSKISSRIKFLLQDLLELKGRGWVQRRKSEAAKSIADLHKELRAEEEEAKIDRRVSTLAPVGLRRASSLAAAATSIDEEGFKEIRRGPTKTIGNNKNFSPASPLIGRPKTHELRRASSQPVSMDYLASPSPSKPTDTFAKASAAPSLPIIETSVPQKDCFSPDECFEKIKNVLKQYFVGGDIADAVLSVDELVNLEADGSMERGAKVVEGGTLMVLEMKETEVRKFLTVMELCFKESKIESNSIVKGLQDPLEFLSDIEVDAPMASNHLATIVSEFLKWNALEYDFLLSAPAFFLSDGKPASFGIRILKSRGGDPSEAELDVVGKLMSENDKETHKSAISMFEKV